MGYPIFPNVPNLPGVPPLLRFPSAAPQIASLAGAIVGNSLSVTSIQSGALYAGSVLSGSGLVNGTRILNQLTGVAGSLGTYNVDTPQGFAGALLSTFAPPGFSVIASLLTDSPTPLQDHSIWGIFDDGGDPVVIADNVTALDFRQDFQISDFSVEEGAFETYNKVYIPYDAKVRFTSGGSLADRQLLLSSIDAIIGDTNLYDVVTPEKTFISMNLTHQSFSRSAQDGVGLLKIDVYLTQVKVNGSGTFSDTTATPSGADQVNDGTVQPQEETSAGTLFT